MKVTEKDTRGEIIYSNESAINIRTIAIGYWIRTEMINTAEIKTY